MSTVCLLRIVHPSCCRVCSGLCTVSGRTELRAGLYLFSPAALEPGHLEVLLSMLHFSFCLQRFCSYSKLLFAASCCTCLSLTSGSLVHILLPKSNSARLSPVVGCGRLQ